jgi:hypothetical protein
MKNAYILGAAAICLALAGFAGAADQVPTDIMMPGTQPNEAGTFESPDKCDNCHGGYDQARVWSNEPAFGWRGGAMGNAGRDPIFWATLAIAEQDFDGAGDLCIRCHSSRGWYGGRSVPTDGSGLARSDDNGIDCDTCHTLTNPDMSEHQGTVGPGFEPYDAETGEAYYGSGMLSLWGGSAKLGPYGDAEARHQFMQSNFHRGDICGSCHDVSNPAVGDLAPRNGAQVPLEPGTFNGTPNALDPNQDPTTKAAFNNPPYAYGIVERTFSEYKSGLIDDTLVTDFLSLPADLQVSGGALAFAYNAAMQAGGTYEDGTPRYFNCQGCHMRPDTGEGCNKAGAPTRFDLPKHDQSGGNYWMWPLIQYQDQQGTLRLGGGLTQTQIEAMDAGRQRAQQQLQMAANLEVIDNNVKITNLTGHKLISGYPEGRRMWLNVRWYCGGVPCLVDGEDGAYGPLPGATFQNPRNTDQTFVPESIIDLDNPDLKIYDAHYAMTQDWANALVTLGWDEALPLSYDRVTGQVDFTLGDLAALPNDEDYHETFHFVLNNYVSKDNRIPPYGFDGTEAAKRNALPVPAAQYGGNGSGTTYEYWDEFTIDSLNPPAGADAADLTLFYQGTSWEYVLFLWKANKGTDPAVGGNAFLGEEGVNMLDAWINADPAAPMVPPFVMATATWGNTGCTPTEPGTESTCNDTFDNDCDGLVDDADPDCAGCTPSASDDITCDGIDDDCNGLIDDGYASAPTSCGTGNCASSGALECVDGSIVDTCAPGSPLPEGPAGEPTCSDTLDNDCDGLTDANDGDCMAAVDCTAYEDKATCEMYPACRWNRKKGCLNR